MAPQDLESQFAGNDNYGKPRMEYVNKIMTMPEEELFRETERAIWLSAYARNNPRSDYHWHASACYAACERFPGLYNKAYEKAKASCG